MTVEKKEIGENLTTKKKLVKDWKKNSKILKRHKWYKGEKKKKNE